MRTTRHLSSILELTHKCEERKENGGRGGVADAGSAVPKKRGGGVARGGEGPSCVACDEGRCRDFHYKRC